ncbi:MAG: hypothetical protein LBB49_01940, partial [Gracilibacteraceae bacterium]|nr:hypothetical protein [Gracilibacteraceae bacterium]
MMKQLEVLGLEKSRTGEIAAAFREMIRGGQILRQPSYLRLVDALDSGGARCLTEVYEQGARDFVERLAGEPMAEAVGKIAARLPLYPYASGVSRRSFRSSSLQANMRPFVRLLGCVFMPKLESSGLPVILRRISLYKNKRGGKANLPADLNVMADFVWEHLIASALDEEGGFVSEEIRAAGESGSVSSVGSVGEAVRAGLSEGKCDRGLRQMLLRAVLKSERRDLFEFVKGYAQTDNGWGWDVARVVELLQAGSEGRVEGQLALLAWVAEYDLWRYEAVAGTVKVWMGFGPFRADGGMMERIVRLALRLAGDPAACRQAIFSSELEGVWAGLWVSTLSDVEEVLPLLKELLRKGDKIQKLAALSFAVELDDKSAQVELVSGLLSDSRTDPDVLCLAMANFDMSYVPTMQTRDGWQGVSRSLSALADAGARDRYFADLSALLKGMPAAGYRLSAEPFRGALSRECLYANLFLIAAADYDKMKISELIDLMPGCEAETRRRFVDVFISESWVKHDRERDFLFQCLHDKSMIVRRTAVEKLAAGGKWDEEGGLAVPLSVGERTAVMKLLAVKTEGMREPCLRILLGQPTETALACAGELCGAKGEEKRLAGLALLEELRVAARITDDTCADVLADAAAVVPLEQRGGEEQDFVRSLRHGTGAETLEQVLGIFDPQYKPAVLERFSLKQLPGDECAVAGVSETRIMSLLAAMCAQVEVHKDFVFTRVNYDFSEEETVLGSLAYPVLPNTTAR